MKTRRHYIFKAYKSEEHCDAEEPYFVKTFMDHTEMKIFSGEHSYKEKKKYPEYVSDYESKLVLI